MKLIASDHICFKALELLDDMKFKKIFFNFFMKKLVSNIELYIVNSGGVFSMLNLFA